jgi:exonuclease VII small subunit
MARLARIEAALTRFSQLVDRLEPHIDRLDKATRFAPGWHKKGPPPHA